MKKNIFEKILRYSYKTWKLYR